ncbi:MAG: 50S ribosomal protein L28 [Gammaproteobacteria bacterium]
MSQICQVTGKRPTVGHKVSHSNIKSKRRFLPNLQTKRIYFPEEKRFVTLRLSMKGLRIIAKKGLKAVIDEMRSRGEKI